MASGKIVGGAIAAAVLAMSTTACTNNLGANQRTVSSVGYASTVLQGTIQAATPVTIRKDNSLLGAGVGAVLGGLAGSELGGGDKANTAGGIAGAVVGGMVGNEAGKSLGQRNGYSYIVAFDSGDVKEIVLAGDAAYAPGTRVNVVFAEDGVTLYPVQAPLYR
jgi:outer membrane lipoprotein SlyB